MRHEMLAYASCRGAIKSGHNLNMYQMTTLIEDLFHTDKPYVCLMVAQQLLNLHLMNWVSYS